MNDKSKYESIINLAHHTSSKHPQMAISDRAAQFSPFAALTGYDAAIKETARYVGSEIELDDDIKLAIDMTLQRLSANITSCPLISATYFKKDSHKNGGLYVTVEGNLKKIDELSKTLQFTDGTSIKIESLFDLVLKE